MSKEKVKFDRPVLIVGTPRSGKTTVSRLVASSGEFAQFDEQVLMWEGGISPGKDDCRTVDMATTSVRESIRCRCLEMLQASGHKRYLDNLPAHALRLPFINAVMPEARIIHVVRDPLECVPEMMFGWQNKESASKIVRRRVAKSNIKTLIPLAMRFVMNYLHVRIYGIRRTWGPRVPGIGEIARSHDAAYIAAHQWSGIVDKVMSDIECLPNLKALQVRFDQLVRNPVPEVEKIARFVEIDNHEQLQKFASANLKKNYVHYEPCRVEPDEQQWQKIISIVKPTAIKLGIS